MASQIKQVYQLICREPWSIGGGQCYLRDVFPTKKEAEEAKKAHDAEKHG